MERHRAALEEFVKQVMNGEYLPANAGEPEQLFAQEHRLLEERRILSLVILPEYVEIRANVHNWNASTWGDWRFANVWLEAEDAAPSSKPATEPQKNGPMLRNPGAGS